jgi:hypothetical protein
MAEQLAVEGTASSEEKKRKIAKGAAEREERNQDDAIKWMGGGQPIYSRTNVAE